ncbi:hypothetical protein CSA56_11275 [candidate division KSB3 bacterium]|uniref:Uncharacterized protein n=1 Tax=candidate division KSB3 bacterium TaxID=2044937 RepID=A0A2G6KDN3_9BACT|nr:MAG: hypothetical protein CSA56_11275 [candidate division KSB3 bacterium]
MMTFRLFALIALLLLLAALTISFLWAQTDLWEMPNVDLWGPQIRLFPTVFALWLPALYIFFTAMWSYLAQQFPEVQRRRFIVYDLSSYGAIFLFFLLLIINKELTAPMMYLKALMLILLGFKSTILFRILYLHSNTIRPWLLFALSFGLYSLSFPFLHIKPDMPFGDIFQSPSLFYLGLLFAKSIGLSVMMLEMFRLSLDMTKSLKSAFLSWLIVSFTFPVLGFPGISRILSSLLIIFVLRLILTRLDTKELITGLLEPASLTIVLKLIIVLSIIGAGGLVFWSNVRPGFGFHTYRTFETAIGTLLNGQFGLFSYAPAYWLSLFGCIYLLFFRVWNGIVLIITGSLFYSGYHFINYGILEKITSQYDSFPFLPFLGIFIAIAHHRFGKFLSFQLWQRLLLSVTSVITALLLLFSPNLPSVFSRISAIHYTIMNITGRDFSGQLPSMAFRAFSIPTLCWLCSIGIFALLCSYLRTRSFSSSRLCRNYMHQGRHVRHEFLNVSTLVFILLLSGAGSFAFSRTLSPLLSDRSLQLSTSATQKVFEIEIPPQQVTLPSKGLFIVSNLTNGVTIPHKTPIISITVFVEEEQGFKTFTLKAGKDTAEENLELPYINQNSKHGRASIYHSRPLEAGDGMRFEAHDYYTRYLFSRPIHIKKITLKLLTAKNLKLPPGIRVHIKEIFLLR